MTCKICNEKKKIEITGNNFFLRTDSKDKKLNDYKNYVIACKRALSTLIVANMPMITDKKFSNLSV